MINQFAGQWRFLSNFYPCEIQIGSMRFSSVEAAYQSAKSTDRIEQASFQHMTPAQAKAAGRAVSFLRENWDAVKVGHMRLLLAQKFSVRSELATRLLATFPQELIEGNFWADTFWGVDLRTNEGRNMLGHLLMERRAALKATS